MKDAATGEGAIVFQGVGYGKAQKSTFTAYSAKGSIHGTARSDNTPNSNHTASISHGTVTITGGAGAYRGAKGTGSFSGTQDLKTLAVKITYKLKYSYKK